MKNLPQYYHDYINDYVPGYPFCWKNRDREKPKDVPGIYLIVLNEYNKFGLEILYVGSSIKLKQRISGHQIVRLANEVYKEMFKQAMGNIEIYYEEINKHNIGDLRLLEMKMIKKIKPRFNIIHL